MDCQDYITESVEREKGQHLQREERDAIQHLKNAGYQHMDAAQAGRRGVQGIPQGIQKAFRPHQRRQADQKRVLRLERRGQKEKRGLRQRRDLAGGVLPLAEGVVRKRCRYWAEMIPEMQPDK